MDQLPLTLRADIVRCGYQNDTYLIGNLARLAPEWPTIVEVFRKEGHEVNESKSEAFLPCADQIPTESLPSALGLLFTRRKRATGDIKTLGSFAQGVMESMLGPYGLAVKPVQNRLTKAISYANSLKQYVLEATDDSHVHIAWMHASK